MQKYVLVILVMIAAVVVWWVLGRLGLFESVGEKAHEDYKKLFVEKKETEDDEEKSIR